MRFQAKAHHNRILELDAPHTQEPKIKQLRKLNLNMPSNAAFIAIDFIKESLPQKMDTAGFQKDRISLFILEGLLMYLKPEAVLETSQTIREHAGNGSRGAFDYIQASVLRHENTLYSEAALVKSVLKPSEKSQFGFEPSEIKSFAADQGFEVGDHRCAQDLEAS